MKQQIQLQIPEPCHEDWNNMSATEQGRFCMACKKEVIDFSAMTDREILRHISSAVTGVCGRADNAQLNRVLTSAPEPRKLWWRYWMGIAASIVMIVSKSNAQVKTPTEIITLAPTLIKGDTAVEIVVGRIAPAPKKNKGMLIIYGSVLDNSNNPIPYASVKLKNSNSGVAADSAGNFVLEANAVMSNCELEISSVGYEPKVIKLSQRQNIQSLATENNHTKLITENIILKQSTMGEVVVEASSRLTSRMAGLMATCVRYTIFEKVKNLIAGDNEIKVYPNPITMNSSFRLVFNLKDPGEYIIRFTDASGRMIASRQLNIAIKNQLENFSGTMFHAAGVYFASVSGKSPRKLYTSRLLVQ
jgi:hypothetical protein